MAAGVIRASLSPAASAALTGDAPMHKRARAWGCERGTTSSPVVAHFHPIPSITATATGIMTTKNEANLHLDDDVKAEVEYIDDAGVKHDEHAQRVLPDSLKDMSEEERKSLERKMVRKMDSVILLVASEAGGPRVAVFADDTQPYHRYSLCHEL